MLNFLIAALTLVSSIAIMAIFSDAYPQLGATIQLVWFIWLVFYALAIMKEMHSGDKEVS